MTRDLFPLRRVPAVLVVAALAGVALDAASPQQSIDLSGDQQVLAFRSAPARRVDVVRGGGYFPVIARLRDGSIAAIVRGGGAHVGVAGPPGPLRFPGGGQAGVRAAAGGWSPLVGRHPPPRR